MTQLCCVNADDHSRVKLLRSSLDYINASLVVAGEADRSYILTQVSTLVHILPNILLCLKYRCFNAGTFCSANELEKKLELLSLEIAPLYPLSQKCEC